MATTAWEMVIFCIIAFLGVALQTTISLRRQPPWVKTDAQLEANWKRLAIYSGVAGLLFGAIALILDLMFQWRGQNIVFAAMGGYIFFQSLFTDFRLRMVDRWIMRAANVISLGVAIYVIAMYGIEVDWLLFIIFLACAVAIRWLPDLGESDGRAFMFLLLSTYPVAGLTGIQWAAVFWLGCIIVFYVGLSISRREFRWKQLLTKENFPLVPLIILPAVLVALIGRALTGF